MSLRSFRALLVKWIDQAQAKDLIAHHVEPRSLLVAIKKRFAPVEKSRKTELKRRYYALQKTLSSITQATSIPEVILLS
jgi:hypothetical protein